MLLKINSYRQQKLRISERSNCEFKWLIALLSFWSTKSLNLSSSAEKVTNFSALFYPFWRWSCVETSELLEKSCPDLTPCLSSGPDVVNCDEWSFCWSDRRRDLDEKRQITHRNRLKLKEPCCDDSINLSVELLCWSRSLPFARKLLLLLRSV